MQLGEGKACSVCKAFKPLSEFHRRGDRSDGLATECKLCNAERGRRQYQLHREQRIASQKQYYEQHKGPALSAKRRTYSMTKGWTIQLISSARKRAAKAGLAFDLDREFLEALWTKQEGLCHCLGVPMVRSTQNRDPQRPSLDRLDPKCGYTRDNVVLTTQFANMGRNVASEERMHSFLSLLKFSWTCRSDKAA